MASISVWVRFPEQQDDEAEEVEVPVGKSISWFKQHIISNSLLKIKSLTDIESVSHHGQVLNNRNKIEESFEDQTIVITLVGKAVLGLKDISEPKKGEDTNKPEETKNTEVPAKKVAETQKIAEPHKIEEPKARAPDPKARGSNNNDSNKQKEDEEAKQEARRRLLEQKQEALRQKALERREQKNNIGPRAENNIGPRADSVKSPFPENSVKNNNSIPRADVKPPIPQNSVNKNNNLGARGDVVVKSTFTENRGHVVRNLLSNRILDIKQQYGISPGGSATPVPISNTPVSTVLPKVKGVPTGLKKEHVKEDLTDKVLEIKKQAYSSTGKTFFPPSSKQSRPMGVTVQTSVVTSTTSVVSIAPSATTTPVVSTKPAVSTLPTAVTTPVVSTKPTVSTPPTVATTTVVAVTTAVKQNDNAKKREVGGAKKPETTAGIKKSDSVSVTDSSKLDKKDLEEVRIAEEARAAAEAHRKLDDVLRVQEASKAEQILKEDEMLRKQRGALLLANLKTAVLEHPEGAAWHRATEEAFAKKRVINDEFDTENAKFYEETTKIEEDERILRAQESQKPSLPTWKLRQWEEGIQKEQQKRADLQRRRQAEFLSKRKLGEKRMLEEAEKHATEALTRDSNADFEASSHFFQLALIVMPDNKEYDDFYNRWTAALQEARKNSPSHQASTHKSQGDLATKAKDWKGAIEAYKAAFNLQPHRDDYKAALEEAEKCWKKQQQDTEAEEEEKKLREVILQRKRDLEDQKRRMEEDLRRQEAEKQEREERRIAELKRLEEERMESERAKEEEEERQRKEQKEQEREAEQKRQEETQRQLEETRKAQLLEDTERQRRREARKTALLSKDAIINEGEELRSMTSRKPRPDDSDHKTEADEDRPRRTRHPRDADGEDLGLLSREPMTSREHSGKTGSNSSAAAGSTEDRRAEVARRRKARQEEEERIALERAERRKRRQQERGGNNT